MEFSLSVKVGEMEFSGFSYGGDGVGTFGTYGVVGNGIYTGVYGGGGSNGVVGVVEEGAPQNSSAVYGWNKSRWGKHGGWAGLFHGNVHVDGNLSKAGGGFKIDHPARSYQQILKPFVRRVNGYEEGVIASDGQKGICG